MNDNGILNNLEQLNDIHIDEEDEAGSHAIVIVGANETEKYFKCKNSLTDNGYFRVGFGFADALKAVNLKAEYYDVFWYESDLTAEDKASYEKLSQEERQKLNDAVNSWMENDN